LPKVAAAKRCSHSRQYRAAGALRFSPTFATTAKKERRRLCPRTGEKSSPIHGGCRRQARRVRRARLGDSAVKTASALFLVDAQSAGVLSPRTTPPWTACAPPKSLLASVKCRRPSRDWRAGQCDPRSSASPTAIAALAAEAVGAMGAMHEITVDYLKQRKQFGVPIGNFQVLQHRAGDMLIALEQARSMAMLATMMSEEENAVERRKAISAAKVQIGRSAKIVGQGAIQLHGGIGMTMEYKVGHYFKRVTMIDTMFGDADYHLGVLARMGGIVGKASAS
jgi:hypothetical protein